MSRVFQAFALLLALVLAGCATTRELPPFEPATTATAVVRWQRASASLNCEAVFARSADGAVLLRLYKQSPSPLLELRLDTSNHLTVRGSLAGPGWSGQSGNAPAALQIWSALLGFYQQAAKLPSGEREIHTGTNRVAYVKTGDTFRSITLVQTDSQEMVSVLFR